MVTPKFYKCNKCQKVVLILQDSPAPLHCCNQPMELLEANTSDGAMEKHVPVTTKTTDPTTCNVQVGSVLHPMLNEHYISWIGSFSQRTWSVNWLHPGQQPTKDVSIDQDSIVYAYCNLHGLWKNK